MELYALQKNTAALFHSVLKTWQAVKGMFSCVPLTYVAGSSADIARSDNVPRPCLHANGCPRKMYGRGYVLHVFCVFRFREAQREFETAAGLLDVLDWRRMASLEHARAAERKFNYHQSQEARHAVQYCQPDTVMFTVIGCDYGETRRQK